MTNRYRYEDSAGEHVHLLDGRPLIGTSRVGSILAKPLTWWASGLAVQTFGCLDPKVLTKIKRGKATARERADHEAALKVALQMIRKLDVEQYAKLIDTAYRAHDVYKRERAATGTDLHAECEKFVKDQISGQMPLLEYYPEQIQPFVEWSRSTVKRYLWSEGHCYSEKHWLGGISDAGYERQDGAFGILDFKSSKEAYMDQFWQCAGYSIQIEENGVFDPDGNQIYKLEKPIAEYCIFPFGAEKPAPQFNYDMPGSREAFLAELLIYKKLPQE